MEERMLGRQAKIVSPTTLQRMLAYAQRTQQPKRDAVTAAAKNVYRAGGSLRDVQLLAGHQSIETTQRYIEGDTPSQRRLVSLL